MNNHTHPAFPQPDDTTIILWRYMHVEKFKWFVEFGRLLMPSADKLDNFYEDTDRLDLAKVAFGESRSIQTELVKKFPSAYLKDLINTLKSCAALYNITNHTTEAKDTLTELEARQRQLDDILKAASTPE